MARNLVSISMDDLISLQTLKTMFGAILHTPNLGRLSAMGVTFDNAHAQVALCSPPRTSVLTGQRPENTGVHDNDPA